MDTLTTSEAADRLGVSKRHVQRLAAPSGPLAVVKRGPGFLLISEDSVMAYKISRDGGPSYADGALIAVGDVVRRGRGETAYRVEEISDRYVGLCPLRGYTRSSVPLDRAEQLLTRIEG